MESVARLLFQKVNTRRNTFQVRVSTLNKKLPKGCTCGKQTHLYYGHEPVSHTKSSIESVITATSLPGPSPRRFWRRPWDELGY